MNKRLWPVTVISGIYILAGLVGFAAHGKRFAALHSFDMDTIWVVLVPLLAIGAGAYMLRGRDWARWLALAWMVFHVILSAFHPLHELAVHLVMLVLFAYFLFRPEATAYFRAAPLKS
jgi:hypothetical protein